MASITVFFKDTQALKDGQYSIFLRVTHHRKHKYIKIGTSTKELWDYENNLPKKKHPFYRELITNIKHKEALASKQFLNLENDDTSFTADEIKRTLKAENKKVTVFSYYDTVVQRLLKEGRLGYSDIFKANLSSLKKYRSDRDFNFSDIHTEFITGYVSYLQENEIKENTIFLHLRNFKTLINYARKDNIVRDTYNPFKEISFSKYRKIKTEKRAIRIDKTMEIESFQPEKESRLWHSKNYYLFSYYTMGTNFVDMAKLTWDNIQSDILIYTRTKTKKEYKIPLNDKAKAILSYYRENERGKYIFPILTDEKYKSPNQKQARIKRILRYMNADLKVIGAALGLETKFTSYVARHTAATTLKRSGQSIQVIKELMGHDSEKTTEIYLDELDNSVLQGAVNSL
jgi:site-specific recombinase XerD